MARAKSVKEIMSMTFPTFPFEGEWRDAFGQPERRGVWFIWGNSGSGKSTFTMQLCKELSKYGKVVYDSLEEGISESIKKTLRTCGMIDAKRLKILKKENIADLIVRLKKQKSPDMIVIDSFQYTMLSYRDYIKLKEQFPHKLIIFVSHADGKEPDGRPARSVKYDADLKIWVEGYRAFSKGRFMGSKSYIDVWPERAEVYWGNKTMPTL